MDGIARLTKSAAGPLFSAYKAFLPRSRWLLGVAALLLSSCAPGLGTHFNVSTVETVPPARGTSAALTGMRVKFNQFADKRSESAVAQIAGRELEPAEDVAQAARRIVESQFKAAGVRPGLYEGAELNAQVLDWMVSIKPGFPSTKTVATASIRLEVKKSTGELAYGARYSGSVEDLNPIGSSDRIERIFSRAMAEAAAEALRDNRFVAALHPPG